MVVGTRGVTRVAAPLRMQVVEQLREMIVSGDYGPGDRLVEAPLCEHFGVSRTVVREAIRQLESEGLVTIIANRGPVVAELTVTDAQALYEVRASLEGLAGRLFAERAGPEQRAELRSAVEGVAAAFEQTNLRVRLAAKDRFYEALIDGAGNEIVRQTLRGIHARVQLLRGLSLQAPGRAQDSLEELRRIVEAATSGDGEAARLACEDHVRQAGRFAVAMVRDGSGRAPSSGATHGSPSPAGGGGR
ncbi:transcriptional regulator, GntR family [Pseudonocardia dioxanivorans CB1190]|uniref:Transcriptional regulator, GntR family n=1 Tax=Pseudonocardia dioxanivorans (strain ATCC 55486 / DSM 44775 / JCM 13855 / CB1190) TaxID=675635 RepID=F4CTP5_PSEUX|nr:GntR family transcriptional regulator [Pseudonocardia dioxanivorans]AEA28548.1 transcriptional regulator, GntR family [Pseudonocardia dioxanivorans CB1190]